MTGDEVAGVKAATGFTVIDGVALVLGSAIASLHLRGDVGESLQDGLGWPIFWATFAGIAMTAAGPFVYLARRYGGRLDRGTRTWERLWAIQGVPWAIGAGVRSFGRGSGPGDLDLYALTIALGVGLAAIVTLLVVWNDVLASTAPRPGEPTSWTSKVGLVLAVSWPLQCGFGLVVIRP